jgi:pimeloyl-ACP methyl ester carboxylesterase
MNSIQDSARLGISDGFRLVRLSPLITLSLIFFLLVFPACQKQSETPSTEVEGTINSLDGVPLAYSVQGIGDPALVFVHCWCCKQSFWDAQVPYFAQKHRVVTLDLAGHGESGTDREKWTIQSFGRDVVSVAEKLELEQIILVGHSMGGPVILEAARHMPERVIGLVGVDNFQDMGQRWRQEELDKFLGAMRTDFEGTTRDFVLTMFPPAADSALVGRVAAEMSSALPEVGMRAMEAMFTWYEEEFDQAVAEIDAPLHCISSDLWPTNVEGNKRYFPSFEVSLMPGRGHFIHMEDPETFNRLLNEVVERFLRDVSE